VDGRLVAMPSYTDAGLLFLSHGPPGGERLRGAALDLGALLAQQAQGSETGARARGVALDVRSPAEPVVVMADPERIAQVLANLVGNAIKYTAEGGRVTLRAEREGGFGALSVRDTGLGIPTESIPRLFDPFYRVPEPKHQEAEGTGLGLSIVKAIVDQHKGDVRVESAASGPALAPSST
jgi:signal transduction histidine kinase